MDNWYVSEDHPGEPLRDRDDLHPEARDLLGDLVELPGHGGHEVPVGLFTLGQDLFADRVQLAGLGLAPLLLQERSSYRGGIHDAFDRVFPEAARNLLVEPTEGVTSHEVQCAQLSGGRDVPGPRLIRPDVPDPVEGGPLRRAHATSNEVSA